MEAYQITIVGLAAGYLLDLAIGDPIWLPHPIVYYGKAISFLERNLRKGKYLLIKGALAVLLLVGGTFTLFYTLMELLKPSPIAIRVAVITLFVFYGLANTTLIKEVRNVFKELKKGVEQGRKAVGRIVGRDTAMLDKQQIRKAALETLSENLSDGVIAPLFYFALLGIPGIMAYKMVNTLDSMWGYKNERYLLFGRMAARLDDIANFIPARITAILMAAVAISINGYSHILRYGHRHASPNSGYPESALAGILGCQLGGGSYYGGQFVSKPVIGDIKRDLTTHDMEKAIRINHKVTIAAVLIIVILYTTLK